MKAVFFFVLIIIVSIPVRAQQQKIYSCFVEGDSFASNKITRQWAAFQKTGIKPDKNLDEQVFVLPVVFHIIHQNGVENLSDAEVMQALQTLNDGFANAGFYDQGSGINTNITFCLAHIDPAMNYTTGINHVFADFPKVIPPINDGFLKSFIDWDPTKYINIWVVKDIQLTIEVNTCGGSDLDAVGYATLPSSHGSSADGIVLEGGSLNSTAIVHEMGHYLGLYHTFEGECINNDCTTDGDQVCDTPPQSQIDAGCANPKNSCNTDIQSGFSTDQNDIPFNFMDYTACAHNFTPGQKDRMRFMITNVRNSLLAQNVCAVNCNNPQDASFSFPDMDYKIGDNITFTPISASPSQEWSVNGNFISSSANLDYIFPGQGWFKIELLAKPSPDDAQCRNKQVNYVHVYCAVKARISVDKIKVALNESVHFSSDITIVRNGPESVTYSWYYNNTLFSNSPSTDFAFQTSGNKSIYLVIKKGSCTDTSNYELVDVKPLPDYKITLEGISCDPSLKKIQFSICNEGFFPVPPGLPVSIYSDNPTTGNAQLIGSVYATDAPIDKFCCKSFQADLPSNFQLTGKFIYAVVNDNGTLSRPYSFSQFPNTQFGESDYTNNLDSLKNDGLILTISPKDTVILSGSTFAFTAITNNPATIKWTSQRGTFNCDTCAVTNFSADLYTKVIATATSGVGCTVSDTAVVKIYISDDIRVPNAFTPNQDGLNDIFYVLGGENVARINSMGIYNRLGQKVFGKTNFQPNDPSQGWDGTFKGKGLSTQIFVYYFTAEFINGSKKAYKGIVTLIR
ncbi:MAG: M43 family zinc metalloprotease [Ginsengibacter sp.]